MSIYKLQSSTNPIAFMFSWPKLWMQPRSKFQDVDNVLFFTY